MNYRIKKGEPGHIIEPREHMLPKPPRKAYVAMHMSLRRDMANRMEAMFNAARSVALHSWRVAPSWWGRRGNAFKYQK